MRILSREIFLRLVQEEDAEFIVDIRTDKKNARFISSTSVSVDEQRKWIQRYKIREDIKDEYYFVGCFSDGTPFGTTRLYDFNNDIFTNGSWVVKKGTKPSYSALLDVLVRTYAFNNLQFSTCFFDVRKNNYKVIKFHQMLGAKYAYSDELNNYYNIQKIDFFNSLNELVRLGIFDCNDLAYDVCKD